MTSRKRDTPQNFARDFGLDVVTETTSQMDSVRAYRIEPGPMRFRVLVSEPYACHRGTVH